MKSVEVTEKVDRLVAAHTDGVAAVDPKPSKSPQVEAEEEGEELFGEWDTEAVLEVRDSESKELVHIRL